MLASADDTMPLNLSHHLRLVSGRLGHNHGHESQGSGDSRPADLPLFRIRDARPHVGASRSPGSLLFEAVDEAPGPGRVLGGTGAGTLEVPEPSGEIAEAGGSPLVLHRNVAAYRLVGGLGTAPAHRVRGPLRLLVAIASPETAEAELLDYEAELARIVAAVSRPAGGARPMCGC